MLKKRHIAVNILTAIAAVFLGVLLVVCLLGTSLYHVAVRSVSAKSIAEMTRTTVTELVESVDFEEVILKNETVKQNIEELDISTDAVGELLQSDAANEVIDLLAADAAGLLNGDTDTHLTADALIRIVKNHADDLAEIAAEMTNEPDRKEELEALIVETVERDAEELTKALPDMEALRSEIVDEIPVTDLGELLNPAVLWAAYGLCLILAALIYLCRWYRFGGFCWLGVNSLLVGGLLAVIAVAIRIIGEAAFTAAPDGVAGILRGLIGSLQHKVQVQAYILLGAAVLLIAGYILLQKLVVKKKIAAAMMAETTVEATPDEAVTSACVSAQEEIPVAEEPVEATQE